MIDITRFLVVIFLKSQDRRRVINTLNFFFLTADRPLCAKYVAFVRCGTKGNTKHRRKRVERPITMMAVHQRNFNEQK